ncbi:gluconokinase [Corallococcus sp. M34]|uniref:gluconokinase n=1 Tax=Citreicoccus inhibens TaxID=2849499 RepID=UPI001C235E38|nr:gluconokinase [Citreicoccus inhibens]MBU8895915.1 gluconokinase [Citreicoccus inhibens]
MVVTLMGVSGSGKTTVGRVLAQRLGWRFVDADDLHPPENVRKMASGQPLTDEDRGPWLARVTARVTDALSSGEDLVLACSALRASYRSRLTVDSARQRWVSLYAPREVIVKRLFERTGHFMPPALLDSQLALLEAPADALVIDVTPPPDDVAKAIIDGLKLVPHP